MNKNILMVLMCLAIGLLSVNAADVIERNQDRGLAQRLLATYAFVGSGSGVVISSDGLVLTNHHVIDDLDDLTVRFANGTARKSHLVGTDPVGDIALLQIEEASDLPFAQLADASAMQVGIDVYAIGNPFGLGDLDDTPTLTVGVLSASRVVRGDYTDVIQGDAPVNPGNSGGPLFDREGRLLGINGQIRTVSGFRVNSGIGLAIASTQIAAFLPLLKAANGGFVHHTAPPKGLELKAGNDAVEVVKPGDSPLSAGDVILSIADRRAISVDTALGLFASLPYRSDTRIAVVVRRNGKTETLPVPAARTTIPGRPYHGIDIDQRGDHIVIDHVDDGSPAKDAELKVGDIITVANGRELKRKIDWLKAVVKLEIGDYLNLTIKNKDDTTREVSLYLRPR